MEASILRSHMATPKTRILDKEAGTKIAVNQEGQYIEGSIASLKLLIFGSKSMVGRKLYCKFYHSFRKHKTSISKSRRNPFWNEWFPLYHIVGRLEPQIHIELWGSGILGNEIKGQFSVNFVSLLDGRDVFIDKYYKIKGHNGEIRIKIINIDRLPKWINSAAAQTALAILGKSDPDGTYATIIDNLKGKFPHIPYEVIANIAHMNEWSQIKAEIGLKALPSGKLLKAGYIDPRRVPSRVTAPRMEDPGEGCLGVKMLKHEDHESYMKRLNSIKAQELRKMLPEVDAEEINVALEANNYNLCLAADELILRHRGTTLSLNKNTKTGFLNVGQGKKAEYVSKIDSLATEGGFIEVKQQARRGQKMIVHSSMVQDDFSNRTPGKDVFEKRQKIFQMRLNPTAETPEE